MRFRNTLTLFLLSLGLVFALSAWAQDKPFTEQQIRDMVKAGLGNDAGAKLVIQRGIDFTPSRIFLLHLKSSGAKEVFLKALRSNKPLSEKQIDEMVRAGVGDDSGAQMVTQRGLDFAPTEEYIQTVKSGGAKEVFVKALRDKMPTNQVQIVAQLAAESPIPRITTLVKDRGVDFEVKDDYLQQVRLAGGNDGLVAALKSAKVMAPDTVNPAAQSRQVEIRQRVAHGAELKLKGQYAEAEKEFRAAIAAGRPDADIYLSLAMALGRQRKWDDDVTTAREALRLNPDSEMAHIVLGLALGGKSDWDAAAAEDREALRLNSKDNYAHAYLGVSLGGKHDWDGEIAEEREALRLNPNNDFARANLGAALGNKGDWDGAIAEDRTAVRLSPNLATAHGNLGVALKSQGNMEGAIEEYRAALRLDPNDDGTHFNLGNSLFGKSDWAGAIAEYRSALRLNPGNYAAHNNLGAALEQNGDWKHALEEYRAAAALNPHRPIYQENYRRLVHLMSKSGH